MFKIRRMQEQDAETVRQVDRLAFLPFLQKQNPSGPIPIRTRANILAALAPFPQGCFVAEADGRLVAYIFCHKWGEVGWLGTFGVHPEVQGLKVGRELLAEGARALEAAGCTTIGLETMPDNPYNVGLYARRGFRPLALTLEFEKTIADVRAVPRAGAYRLARPGAERDLEQVTALSRAAWPEQDLRPEAENALSYAWGEVLLLEDGIEANDPWGAAILRVVHRREGEAGQPLPNETCEVSALACRPAAPQRLHLAGALGRCEHYAAGRGFKRLRLTMNSADWQSLQVLLSEGYHVVHSRIRMVLRGSYDPQPGIEFSRWAM